MKKLNVQVVGVGGQGAVLLGQILKLAALRHDNIDVVGTETRGAAQREGCVDATIRYAITEEGEEYDPRKGVHGVLIPTGCLLYTSPSPRDVEESRMPSSA